MKLNIDDDDYIHQLAEGVVNIFEDHNVRPECAVRILSASIAMCVCRCMESRDNVMQATRFLALSYIDTTQQYSQLTGIPLEVVEAAWRETIARSTQ